MEEVEELKKEIMILEKRIDVLEKTERRRKTTKLILFIIKVAFYVFILVCIWKIYDYVTSNINNLPNLLNEKLRSLIPFR